ncbi:MAG: hypothetical protein OEV91_05180, partial [Desulfobulbaceae bacterium]|nr:hypothetical protein [Desulfobulbaceae bacterium]
MSVKNKAILLVSLIIVSLFLFSLYHVLTLHNRSIENQIREAQKSLGIVVTDVEKYSFSPYQTRIKGIWKTDPRIAEAFAGRDRDLLYRAIEPKYQTLVRENSYFRGLSFYLPSGASFLRLQDPARSQEEPDLPSDQALLAVHRLQVPLTT